MGSRCCIIMTNIDSVGVSNLHQNVLYLRLLRRRLLLAIVLLLQSPILSTTIIMIMNRTSISYSTFGVVNALIDRTYHYIPYRRYNKNNNHLVTSIVYQNNIPSKKRSFLTFQLHHQQQQQRIRNSLLQLNYYNNKYDSTIYCSNRRYSNIGDGGIIQSNTNHQWMKKQRQQQSQRQQRQIQKCYMSVSGIIYDSYNEIANDRNKNNNDNNNTNESSITTVTTTSEYNENHNHQKKIIIKLFTKESCTLCDKVQSILYKLRHQYPHVLEAIDITDPKYSNIYYEQYKYDIPILHINDMYWTKHRITIEEAQQGLYNVSNGLPFQSIGTEPNATNCRPISSKK